MEPPCLNMSFVEQFGGFIRLVFNLYSAFVQYVSSPAREKKYPYDGLIL